MASFKNYNNNERQLTSTTYSPISFANPDSIIAQTRLSISYFNKLLKISIANKSGDSNGGYATYDNDNAISVYVSWSKAKILLEMIEMLKTNKEMHNVCVELKNGLLMVSDGIEYGSETPCISISYAREDGAVNTIIYQTKGEQYYSAAYNYSDGKFESKYLSGIELDTFVNVLREYYNASTYAMAATVMEAGMYHRAALNDNIAQIADKVGVVKKGGNYNSKSFLGNSNNSAPTPAGTRDSDTVPNGYEKTSFDDIANNM